MRGAFAISIVLRFNTNRKNVVWAPAIGGPLGFSLVSLMDNTALPLTTPLASFLLGMPFDRLVRRRTSLRERVYRTKTKE